MFLFCTCSLAEFLGDNFERFKWLSVNPHMLERRPMRTEERRKLLDQNFGQSGRIESLMAELESSPAAKAHPAPNKVRAHLILALSNRASGTLRECDAFCQMAHAKAVVPDSVQTQRET